MRERLQQRLQPLKSEFEAGQQMLTELEAKQANLQQTLLRISGAIQVLEEVLNDIPEEDTPFNPDLGKGAIAIPSSGSGAIAPPDPSAPLTI